MGRLSLYSYLILVSVTEKRSKGLSHYKILTRPQSFSDLSHQSRVVPLVSRLINDIRAIYYRHSPKMGEIGPRICMYTDVLRCSKIHAFLGNYSPKSNAQSHLSSRNRRSHGCPTQRRKPFIAIYAHHSRRAWPRLFRGHQRLLRSVYISALESPLISWIVPTCFAQTLESLVLLPGPVRESVGKPLLPSRKALSAPRELLRILDWLMVHPLADNPDELFCSRSPPELLAVIREVSVSKTGFITINYHSMAFSVLMMARNFLSTNCPSNPRPLR